MTMTRINPLDAAEPEICEAFGSLACQLSPENLTCDGELCGSRVYIKRKNLMHQWRELEKKLGLDAKVTESDLWDWERRNRKG